MADKTKKEDASETKLDKGSSKEEKKDDTETKDEKPKNEVDLGAPWKCRKCGMSNPPGTFECSACYSTLFFRKKNLSFKLPEKQKGLIKTKAKEGFDYVELEVPQPGEGELLIKSYATGVCGSDVILYKWTKDAATIAKLPFTPGHESAGLVVASGKNAKIKPGTRVAIENHFFCGECFQCKLGRTDICANLNQFGHGKGTKYGGLSQYFIVNEKYCYRLRSAISWRDAALLEPLGVAYNACVSADIDDAKSKKETCLVLGCGTIGLLAIGVLKAKGYTNIIGVDVVKEKLEVAKKLGASEVINAIEVKDLKSKIFELTENVGCGKVIECSGVASNTSNVFNYVRKGGNVVLVGLPKSDLVIKDPMKELVFKSITLRTVHGRRIFATWRNAERLVSKQKINLDYVMSKRYDMVALSKYKQVYADFLKGKEMKIVFDPQK